MPIDEIFGLGIVTFSQLCKDHPSSVMPRCLVFGPRVAEANDNLHGGNLPVTVEERAN